MNPRDALKAGLFTSLWTFLAMFGLSLMGWLARLAEWASSSGQAALPGLSSLGYAAVSAAVAAAGGLVGTVVRLAQGKGWLPGPVPTYAPPDQP